MNIYKELGVRTYINALDPVSSLGGSLLTPAVLDAMEEASKNFVRMEDLHEAVGARLASLTQNPGAVVVAGTAAGMMMCAAVLMTHGDYGRMMGLPDVTGLKNEILVLKGQSDVFNAEMCITGAKIVTVDAGHDAEKLRAAINENTCAIFFAQMREHNTLSFEETLAVAKGAGIELVVNAAAQLPPKDSLWMYTQKGAVAAVFAGGRALRGPSGSALVVGDKRMTDAILSIAPPKHSIASVANIGREEIVGLYVAVEEYMAGDDFAARIERVEGIIRSERHRIDREGYFLCRRSYPGPAGQHYPRMMLEILGSYSAEVLVEWLAQGDPAILVERAEHDDSENGIYINLLMLTDTQVQFVLRRVLECAEELTLL